MNFYFNVIDFIKMLPYYRVSSDFSFMEIYADDGCIAETCPERNQLLVLYFSAAMFLARRSVRNYKMQ